MEHQLQLLKTGFYENLNRHEGLDWNKIEDTFETIDNELSSVLCDAYDLKNFLKVQKMAHVSKDNDGSIIPIIDCAESIIKFLESIERNNK